MRTIETIQSIYNSVPIASIIVSPDHPKYTIRIVNESFLRETNTSREQLIGRDFFEAFSVGPAQAWLKIENIAIAFEQVLRSKGVHRLEGHRYDVPSATKGEMELRYWDIDSYPLLDETGEVEYIVMGAVNVTARQLADLKLEKSNQKLNKILNSITDGFFVLDKDRRVSYWNTAAETISRRSAEQVIGRSIWDIYPDAMIPELRQACQKAEEEQTQVQLEQYNPEVSRWYEITLQPTDEGAFVYFKDICYRKEAEQRAQIAFQRNYDLFNFSPVPMWAYHTGTLQMVASNQAAQAEYEYSAEEFLQLTARDVWAKEEFTRMDKLIDTKVRAGLLNEGLVKHVTKSGKELHVQMKSQPLPTWGKEIRIVMALDITEKLNARKELSTSNARLQALVDAQTNYVMRIDQQGRYTYYNNKYKNDFSWIYGKDDFLGEDSRLTVVPYHQDRIAETAMKCIKKPGVVYELEIDKRDQEGKFKATFWHFVALTDALEDQQELQGIGIDITEQKKVEMALHTSNDRYAYVNKATNDVIYDWDILNDHVDWGAAFTRLLGYAYSGAHYPISEWTDLIHPKEANQITESLSAALNDPDQTNWKAEYSFKKADGRYVSIEENGYIIKDDQGRSIRMIGVLRDISERKASAEALQAAKNRYKDVFELSPQPMWVYEVGTLRFLDVNAAAIQNYGFSKSEFLSMTLLDIRPEQDKEALKQAIREDVQQGKPHSSFFWHRKKNGEIIRVLIKGNSLQYEGKGARIVIAIDDTARLKAEEALRISERRFKTLIQDGSDLITIINPNGDFKYVSPTAEKTLGVPAEALLGTNGFNFIHEEDRGQILEKITQLGDAVRIQLAALRMIGHNGEVRWVELILTNMQSDPAIQGIVCNARDVTERVENELKVREHLERYNIVSKATSDAIWDLKFQTDELIWNYAVKEIFGYSEGGHNYNWWYERVHPEDRQRVTQVVQDSIQEKEPRWSSEYRFRCADGSYKFVLDRGFLVFDEEGAPVRMIGAIQDITERINYIHEIERHNSLLREIGWAQAHLVRGPMARILGLLELLTLPQYEDFGNKELLQHLNTSAQELDEVIRQIIHKSESGPEL
ncbi:PAS domain-containing protein [Arcticibacter sp.]|uniref:PAS domain-containing protein n=1 Tax=Arcticibacter sp. TaxID=1872630 RepID=UPI00388DE4C5